MEHIYRAHIFTSSGTFDVTQNFNFYPAVDVSLSLVVVVVVEVDAGGGGGAGGAMPEVQVDHHLENHKISCINVSWILHSCYWCWWCWWTNRDIQTP